MRPLLWLACIVMQVLLASCGGGGGGSVSDLPPVDQPTIRAAAGTFYRQDGIVILGQTVTAIASLPAGSVPLWRFTEVPGSGPTTQLTTTTPGQASFVASAPGTYRLEVSAAGAGTAAPVSATFTVVPPQIEFVVDVTHSGGMTTVAVHGGAANAPMAGCLVYSGSGCTPPTSVEATLDGVSLGALTSANASSAGQPAYEFSLATAGLGPGQHDLRVDVYGPMQSYGGRVRQGFLIFDTSKAAQLGVFGLAATDLGSQVSVQRTVSSSYGPRVGDRLTATGSISGLRSGATFAGATMRLVERPADSAATVDMPQVLNAMQVTADFVADKPGRYTLEFVPILSDGSTTPPVYATAVVRPHELFFTVTASSHNQDDPPLAPDTDRIAVQVSSDRSSDSSPVTLWLDDTLVGTQAFPNVIRRVTLSLARFYTVRVYAFDIPNAQLGTGPHIARLVIVDTVGRAHEGSLAFAVGADAEAGFGPFEDPNP